MLILRRKAISKQNQQKISLVGLRTYIIPDNMLRIHKGTCVTSTCYLDGQFLKDVANANDWTFSAGHEGLPLVMCRLQKIPIPGACQHEPHAHDKGGSDSCNAHVPVRIDGGPC